MKVTSVKQTRSVVKDIQQGQIDEAMIYKTEISTDCCEMEQERGREHIARIRREH